MAEELEEIELRSEEVQEVLDKVPTWMIRYGSFLFLALVILFLILSWIFKYPDVIESKVYLTTKIPPQKVYSRFTGNIEKILVEPDSKVQKDQNLAILENTADYKDIQYLSTLLDTIDLSVEGIDYPIEQMPVLELGEVEPSYAEFENNYIEYTINRKLNPLENEFEANSYSVNEIKTQIANLKNQIKIAGKELSFLNNDLSRYDKLFRKGVVAAIEYEDKQIQVLQSKRNYESMRSNLSRLRDELAVAEMSSRSTEIRKTREDIVLRKKVIQSYNKLLKEIRNWENLYVLKSEISGIVTFLQYWNANQSVNEGELVFFIIPNNQEYIAKILAPALNSGKIKNGQEVHIKLHNYPSAEFGVLNGRVKNVSKVMDKEGLYFIDVALPDRLITTFGKKIVFKQEMAGEAEIVIENLRLIERIFYQLKDILN